MNFLKCQTVALLSTEGQKSLRFHQKDLHLCSEDERKSYHMCNHMKTFNFWVNYAFNESAFITCKELAMGPAMMPRLILLLLFFWLSESRIFFSERNPAFDTVRRSWLDGKKYTLLSLSGWTANLFFSVFSEGVWEENLWKWWMFFCCQQIL